MATETIYALFQSVADAERAIGALEDHGIPSGQIGVIARQPAQDVSSTTVRQSMTRLDDERDEQLGEPVAVYAPTMGSVAPPIVAGTETPTSVVDTAQNVEDVGKKGITTTTAADAGTGAGIGAGIGLIAGILAAAASLAVPGVGFILAGGALAGAVAAAAATTAAGAIAGGVAGYLRDMGMPDQAASKFEERVIEGDYLISVMMDTSQYDDVKTVLLKYNATGIDFDPIRAGGMPWRSWGEASRRTYFDTTGQTSTTSPSGATYQPTSTPSVPVGQMSSVTPADHIILPSSSDEMLDEEELDVDDVQTRRF